MKKILFFVSICAVGTFMAMGNGTEATEIQKAKASNKQYCIYSEQKENECMLGEGNYCIANIVDGKCVDLEIKPEN